MNKENETYIQKTSKVECTAEYSLSPRKINAKLSGK
jgi:hypothetical protein